MARKRTTKDKPVRKARIPLPEYTKPYEDFVRTAQEGDHVSITRRTMSNNYSSWDLVHIDGKVREMAPNCLVLTNGKHIPYYVIHDWEVVDLG